MERWEGECWRGSVGQGVLEGGDSGGGGREGEREWWCWASHFCSGAVVCVHGCSFSFIVGVVVSWALVINERGVVIIHGGPSVSLGIVVCGRGHCSWGWAMLLVGVVVICGAGLLFVGAVSSLVGAGCR